MKWTRKGKQPKSVRTPDLSLPQFEHARFGPDLKANENMLRELFRNCSDIVFRPVRIEDHPDRLLVYAEVLVNAESLEPELLRPMLVSGTADASNGNEAAGNTADGGLLNTRSMKREESVMSAVSDILRGFAAVLTDGESSVTLVDRRAVKTRAIEEPTTEISLRGPREGFTESVRTNISMVRRKLKTPRLKMEHLVLGKLSQTDVVIAYIEGIAKDSIIEEVRRRVGRIETDAVLESGNIEEFIQDQPFSVFPQALNTERPDVVAGNLLEGKVAILVDGTPFSLVVPVTFWTEMQAPDDYYEHFIFKTFIRWLRYLLLTMSLLLPSLYVAATTYHPQLIPSFLLISIAASREGIPFPAMVEAFLMEFMFEALREAGIRLPKSVGQAVSIVGALVVGEAAVRSGIVSAPTVIIVSTTGISSFVIPRYNFGFSARLLRFPLLLLAGTLGLYGIGLGLILIAIHLVNLTSLGLPYMSPLAPQVVKDLKDVLMRAPIWAMNRRPAETTGVNENRIPAGQMPGASKGDNAT
ncbi:spore germination protein [Paenibacillus humicola]|uniref:spore germination protein n=1 Tax=Paenibacillus humicola TaxID=3110540 RepID=UPI00237A46FB|nr:spore germination protein [Paenibacillus humicola]